MFDSLQPHESEHIRPPCPSPIPGVYSNSCPSSWQCHPAISSSVVPLLLLPPIPPSIRVFSNELTLHMRWPKYCSFSFSISPSNEHPGLIFRMDRLDLLAVQGTLKRLLSEPYIYIDIYIHTYVYIIVYYIVSCYIMLFAWHLTQTPKLMICILPKSTLNLY